MVAKRAILVRDPPRAVPSLFHDDLRGPDIRFQLIPVPVMRHGPIAPHDPRRLQAQHPVERRGRRTRPMQIGRLGRLDGTATVVAWQPGLQEPIRRLDRREACQAQVFDQPILQRLEQRSTRPLACGEWAWISSPPSSASARANGLWGFSPANC